MKTLYHLLTLVMGLILFVSCDKESEVLQNPEEKILKIQVTDKGYASDPANKETKAIDEEFKTTFENGDKIGVFIVDEDGSITYANVPVTLKDNVWVDETQGVRIKSTTEKVFAYYPYVEDSKINGLVNPGAESESDFFAGYINSLDISDQSTLSRYRQADVLGCMVKKASISEGTIIFNMSHLMGLVVLDFDVKQMIDFTLESDPDYTWRRTLPVSVNMQLNNGKLMVKQGEALAYYYLVNPNEVQTLNGEISKDNEVQSFVLSELPAASLCKSYRVTATLQTIGKATHRLQVGDIFKSDGGLISQKELNSTGITEEEKDECVGIVFQTYYKGDGLTRKLTGRIGSTEIEKLKEVTKNESYLPHGLVMALKNASPSVQWKTSKTDSPLDDMPMVGDGYQDINGLQNCTTITMTSTEYPAFKAAGDYNRTCFVSEFTTGWFLPSFGQWWDILENLGKCYLMSYRGSSNAYDDISVMSVSASQNINSWYKTFGENKEDIVCAENEYFWTSSEYSSNGARNVSFFNDDKLSLNYSNKTVNCLVRCVLAF